EVSADELALNSTSFSYPVKETETSADKLVFTSFSRPIEDEISDDELSLTTDAKPTTSKKRPGTGLKKIFSNQRSSINASRRRRIRTSRRTIEEHKDLMEP